MRRGTTPTINLSVPYASYDIARAWITFAQRGTIILNKELTDPGVEIEDITEQDESVHAVIHVSLTQEDTLAFTANPAELQVRLLMNDGKANASGIYNINMARIIKDGVITPEA